MSESTIPQGQEQDQEKEITSTANHIQLLEWKPEAFAGIDSSKDPSQQLIIHLNEAPIIGFESDQGTGKSSLLSCLVAHLGGEEIKNSAHIGKDAAGKETKSRKSTLSFTDSRTPNVTYTVQIGKSSITIKKIENVDGTLITGTVNSPKEFLYNMFGPVGVSPMILKDQKGKDQIKWIRDLYKFTAEQEKQEEVLKTKYKNKFTERTGVNNDVKRLYKEVLDTTLYVWDTENKCFIPSDQKAAAEKFVKENNEDEVAINNQFDVASKNMRALTEANTRLEQRTKEKGDIEREIRELEEKLAAKRVELSAKEEQIKTGEEYKKQFENAEKDMEAIRLKMNKVGDVKLAKKDLETSAAKVKEYQEKEDKQVQLNADLDEISIDRKKFIKQFTPDIPGLELIINDSIDGEATKPEGIYYNGRTPAELSESELWDLFMQILRSVKCYFICIENLSSLGTAAIERINWFVETGRGQVFYTAMQRGVKEIKVTMHTKLA